MKNAIYIIGALVVVAIISWLVITQNTPAVETLSLGATTTQDGTENNGINENTGENPDTLEVGVALISLEDDGAKGKKIGCGDSVLLVEQDIPYTTGVLRSALEALLALGAQPNGYYNALAASALSIDEVVIEDGVATIELSGALSLGGVCDSPRVEAQLEETALQFESVESVEIFINGTPIDEALSNM